MLRNNITVNKSVIDDIDEKESGDKGDKRPKGTNGISTSIRVWIIAITTGKTSNTKEMHRKESNVNTNEKSSELNLS